MSPAGDRAAVIVRIADIGTARSLPFVERIQAAARETMPHATVEPVGQWWLAQQGMNRLSVDVMVSAVTALLVILPLIGAGDPRSPAVPRRHPADGAPHPRHARLHGAVPHHGAHRHRDDPGHRARSRRRRHRPPVGPHPGSGARRLGSRQRGVGHVAAHGTAVQLLVVRAHRRLRVDAGELAGRAARDGAGRDVHDGVHAGQRCRCSPRPSTSCCGPSAWPPPSPSAEGASAAVAPVLA